MEQYGCRPTKGNPADQDQLGWASTQRNSGKARVSEALGVSQRTRGHKFGGRNMVSQLVLPNWVKLGKNVWAAELSDADSQPTKRTPRMIYTCYA